MPSSPLPRWILNVSGATVIGFNGEEEIKVGANQRRLNCQLPKMKERPGGWGGGRGDMECGCASGGPCAADARGGELQERARPLMSSYLAAPLGLGAHLGSSLSLGTQPQLS